MRPLIVCNVTDTNDLNYAIYNHPCGFSDLIVLTQNLIYDLVFISTILAAAAFVYAGIILLTSGGSEGKKDKAKKIFQKVLIGYLWILGAWLLVYTITSVLLKPGFSILGAP
ncbi:MAG: hypothetical protein HYT68_02185 [Candidatus Zambryskibacteria bacterium]|nr:hypothetical protein [Candidatus Zambryskibacteria bacterium]